MSGKEKLENDYKNFNQNIEDLAAKALAKIKQDTEALKAEAQKMGEAISDA